MYCCANKQLLAVQSSDAVMMNTLGVRPADCPALLLYDQQNRTKYRPVVGHQLTSSKISLFVRSVLEGKLQVHGTAPGIITQKHHGLCCVMPYA